MQPHAQAQHAHLAHPSPVLILLLCWCTACREERVAEDDEIVQAVNDYTRALQDGLRLVNTT